MTLLGYTGNIVLILFLAIIAAIIFAKRPTGQKTWKFWPISFRIFVIGILVILISQLLAFSGFGSFFVLILNTIGVYLSTFVAISAYIADVARSKGRSWNAFFWISLLVTPIVMGIIAATISPLPDSKKYFPESSIEDSKVPQDVALEIEKLGALKEKGLITLGEFNAKKKELLNRI